MTAPLTPPDCDLQDFPFMPLHVARLRDSDLASEEDPEACWYAVLLWAASWHQIPAASLPDNDAVLTKLIGLGRDLKTFRKHKAGALRGFVVCDDGRLYHPVVAEQAVTAWTGKLQQRWRTECGRLKKQNQRNSTDLPMPTFEEFLSTLPENSRPLHVHGDNSSRSQGHAELSLGTGGACPSGKGVQEKEIGTEKGTGTERLRSVSIETGADAPPDPLDELRKLEISTGSWRLALKVLVDRGGYVEGRARSLVGKWAKALDDHEALWRIAEAAWNSGTLDPISYVTAAIERHTADEAEGGGFATGIIAPSEARQRTWMEDWNAGADWKTGDRGPKPGEPGCRVSAAILAEFRFTQGTAA